MPEEIKVSEIKIESELVDFPEGLSYFPASYLRYWAKETLDVDGEVKISRNASGEISGLFVYDDYESDGTIFTRSTEVFDYFSKTKSSGSIWSELSTDRSTEVYDILAMDLDGVKFQHRFKHNVVLERNIADLEQFMRSVHYGLNPKWVRAALSNGDRCFAAKVGTEIAGIAWLSLVDGIGRVPDLYVLPNFRRSGVARDLFYARLLYLRAQHAKSYFAEIAHENEPAIQHALKVGMKVSGHMFFEYINEE
jgi:GNAT superfamily N-acetyltransferase